MIFEGQTNTSDRHEVRYARLSTTSFSCNATATIDHFAELSTSRTLIVSLMTEWRTSKLRYNKNMTKFIISCQLHTFSQRAVGYNLLYNIRLKSFRGRVGSMRFDTQSKMRTARTNGELNKRVFFYITRT